MTLEEKMNELAKMKMEEGFSTEQIAKLTKLAAEEIENL